MQWFQKLPNGLQCKKNTLDARKLEIITVKCAVEAQQKHGKFKSIRGKQEKFERVFLGPK